jgi:hypothetical protein
MALNMKKVNNKNKADEMIEQMMSENSSSSASYVKALTNISSGQPTEANNAHAETSTKELPDVKTHGVDIDLDIAKPDIEETDKKPIMDNATAVPQKIEHTGETKKRGRRPKAETGEICRVQFSTTLMPDLLDKVKSEAKRQGIPLSCFIEKVFMDYFRG